MNIDFWSGRKTFSLYETGFLLSGEDPVALREDFSNSHERIVQENYGFVIPSIIFKEKKGLTPIPTALKLNKSNYPMKHLGVIVDASAMSADRGVYGYYQWRYYPVSISMVQRAIFTDLIKGIQNKQLICIEMGFVPETNVFEITGYSVTLLLDTLISHEALYVWASSALPDLPKNFFVKTATQSKSAQDEKIPDEHPVKVISHEGDKLLPVVGNTIKELDSKNCILTYNGVETLIKGKGVYIIRQLLMSPFKEFPIYVFTGTNTDVCSAPAKADTERDTEKIPLPQKEKTAYQKGVAELFEDIKDLGDRLKDADELEKMDKIEKELNLKNKTLNGVKRVLSEYKGWIDEAGIIHYREKTDDDGKKIIIKPRKQYINEKDRIRKLCQATIEKIDDKNLKGHLTRYIEYGKELRYVPSISIKWTSIP